MPVGHVAAFFWEGIEARAVTYNSRSWKYLVEVILKQLQLLKIRG